jgi:hypothetical protein
VFNVGTGRETSVVDLYALCARVAGSDANAEHAPARLGELQRSFLDPAAHASSGSARWSSSDDYGNLDCCRAGRSNNAAAKRSPVDHPSAPTPDPFWRTAAYGAAARSAPAACRDRRRRAWSARSTVTAAHGACSLLHLRRARCPCPPARRQRPTLAHRRHGVERERRPQQPPRPEFSPVATRSALSGTPPGKSLKVRHGWPGFVGEEGAWADLGVVVSCRRHAREPAWRAHVVFILAQQTAESSERVRPRSGAFRIFARPETLR